MIYYYIGFLLISCLVGCIIYKYREFSSHNKKLKIIEYLVDINNKIQELRFLEHSELVYLFFILKYIIIDYKRVESLDNTLNNTSNNTQKELQNYLFNHGLSKYYSSDSEEVLEKIILANQILNGKEIVVNDQGHYYQLIRSHHKYDNKFLIIESENGKEEIHRKTSIGKFRIGLTPQGKTFLVKTL